MTRTVTVVMELTVEEATAVADDMAPIASAVAEVRVRAKVAEAARVALAIGEVEVAHAAYVKALAMPKGVAA